MREISLHGDPLEKLDSIINWDIFRITLENVFRNEAKWPGGRSRYDLILMFKSLVLQRLYNLLIVRHGFQVNDPLSFMSFLSIEKANKVPDEKQSGYSKNNLQKVE